MNMKKLKPDGKPEWIEQTPQIPPDLLEEFEKREQAKAKKPAKKQTKGKQMHASLQAKLANNRYTRVCRAARLLWPDALPHGEPPLSLVPLVPTGQGRFASFGLDMQTIFVSWRASAFSPLLLWCP